MATHDYVIANGTGAAVRSDLNDALAAIVSNNSSTSEPATTYAYQWWADTTNNVLKIRNSANNAWITLRELDGTMLIEDGSASAPGLSFASDTNSGLFGGSDTIGFATGGAERLEIGSSEVVINDPANNVDFRVESEGNTHMLFVNAGNSRVGIGETDPEVKLHVNGGTDNTVVKIESSDAGAGIRFTDNHASSSIEQNSNELILNSDINSADGSSTITFKVDSSEKARLDSSGRLMIGTTTTGPSTADDLTIATSGNTGISLRSGTSSAGNIFFSDGTSGGDTTRGVIQYDHNSNFMRFYTDNAERVRIDSSGRVGIGSSSPVGQTYISGPNVSTFGVAADAALNLAAAGGALVNRVVNLNFAVVDSATNAAAAIGMKYTSQSGFGKGDLIFGTRDVTTDTAPTERMRIDSSGRLLVGSSSARENFYGVAGQNWKHQIEGAGYVESGQVQINNSNTSLGAYFNLAKSRGTSVGSNVIVQENDDLGIIDFHGNDGTDFAHAARISAAVDGSPGGNEVPARLQFWTTPDGGTSPSERMRIISSGDVLTATTSQTVAALSSAGVGHRVSPSGIILQVASNASQTAAFNRTSTDGSVIGIRQNGTEEGTIAVSGSTVSFNGGHLSRWSQLAGGAERTEILRGSVLSNLDEMCEWGEENNEQLNRMKVSDVEGDRNVSGVFQAWDDDDDTYTNDFYCAMTGDFVIRIAQGTTVARGDLLMSAGDGTAKPQDDDIVRSKTIAKVTSTTVSTTYPDGSYCVPCVLMAC